VAAAVGIAALEVVKGRRRCRKCLSVWGEISGMSSIVYSNMYIVNLPFRGQGFIKCHIGLNDTEDSSTAWRYLLAL